MRKTAFTASTPVLHLPVKSLLQTASLFFLAFLFALLGQFFVLPVACEQGNTTSSNTALQLNRERQFLHSLAHPQLCMMEKKEGNRGKKTRSNTQGKGEVSRAATELLGHLFPWPSSEEGVGTARRGNNTNSLTSWRRSDSLLQATDHPGRFLSCKGKKF